MVRTAHRVTSDKDVVIDDLITKLETYDFVLLDDPGPPRTSAYLNVVQHGCPEQRSPLFPLYTVQRRAQERPHPFPIVDWFFHAQSKRRHKSSRHPDTEPSFGPSRIHVMVVRKEDKSLGTVIDMNASIQLHNDHFPGKERMPQTEVFLSVGVLHMVCRSQPWLIFGIAREHPSGVPSSGRADSMQNGHVGKVLVCGGQSHPSLEGFVMEQSRHRRNVMKEDFDAVISSRVKSVRQAWSACTATKRVDIHVIHKFRIGQVLVPARPQEIPQDGLGVRFRQVRTVPNLLDGRLWQLERLGVPHVDIGRLVQDIGKGARAAGIDHPRPGFGR